MEIFKWFFLNIWVYIVVIMIVLEELEESVFKYWKVFYKIGFVNVSFYYIEERLQVNEKELLLVIKKLYMVFFLGGDQFWFFMIIGGMDFCMLLYDWYLNDLYFVLVGISVGVMVMFKVMIQLGGIWEVFFE